MPTGSRRTLMQLHSALLLVVTTVAAASLLWAQHSTGVAPNESARASLLVDITRENVGTLQPAWTYHSRDFSGGRGPEPGRAVPGVQVRPVFAGGRLYVTTPSSIVIALDGDTG